MPESGFRGVFQAHQGVSQALQGILKLISESSAKTSCGFRAERGERRRLLRSREVVAVVHWLVWLHVRVARVSEGIFFIDIIKCLVRNFWIIWKYILIDKIICIFCMFTLIGKCILQKVAPCKDHPVWFCGRGEALLHSWENPSHSPALLLLSILVLGIENSGYSPALSSSLLLSLSIFNHYWFWCWKPGLLSCIIIAEINIIVIIISNHCRNQYYFYYQKQSLS